MKHSRIRSNGFFVEALRSYRPIKSAAVALAVVFMAVAPAQSPAEIQDKETKLAIVVFIQSVSSRMLARLCVRGDPNYQQRFDEAYSKWFERFGPWVGRGETAFRSELEAEDQLPLAKERLQEIEQAVADLENDPVDTSPIVLDERLRAVCEQNLEDLSATF